MKVKRVLIVRADRLGDLICTLPMAGALSTGDNATRVILMVRPYTAPIARLAPAVQEVIEVDPAATLITLVRSFRSARADAALFPAPRFRLALAARIARIPERIGTAYRWYSFLFNRRISQHRKTAEKHEAEFNLEMLNKIGVAAEHTLLPNLTLAQADAERVLRWTEQELAGASFAVLHVGSGGSAQDWPIEHFVEIARSLLRDTQLSIVLTGTEADLPRVEYVSQSLDSSSRVKAFIGHSLGELAALLQRARVTLSGSTGPGHLSAALGTPTVGLFPLPSALSAGRWGFRGPRVKNLSPAPLSACPECQNCNCLERLDVGQVKQALQNFLQSGDA